MHYDIIRKPIRLRILLELANEKGYTNEELEAKLGKKDSAQLFPEIKCLKKYDIIYGSKHKKLNLEPKKSGRFIMRRHYEGINLYINIDLEIWFNIILGLLSEFHNNKYHMIRSFGNKSDLNDKGNYDSVIGRLFQENLKKFLESIYTWQICAKYGSYIDVVKPYLPTEDFESLIELVKEADEIMKSHSEDVYEYDYEPIVEEQYELYGEDVLKAIEEAEITEAETSVNKLEKEISIFSQSISGLNRTIKENEEWKSELEMKISKL